MKKRINEVVFDDGSKLELGGFNSEEGFEDALIKYLSDDTIREYADYYLDMIEQGECENTTIEDFHYSELVDRVEEFGFLVIKADNLRETNIIDKLKEVIKNNQLLKLESLLDKL